MPEDNRQQRRGGSRLRRGWRIALFLVLWPLLTAQAQQIRIPRIELMPNQPRPYAMRDWKRVAVQYDSLVFDVNRVGKYLPLIWKIPNPINYPEHESFGLPAVVGPRGQPLAEAINVLPAVIGASLVGMDKRQQYGENWVLMCEEFFNRRPQENIYLNLAVTQSGQDWWYETMPNVFFYQLYDLYPGTGDFERQFRTVADRWLEAVRAMGGGDTPWRVPYMNYRAWAFANMKPRTDGVPEPEAAGAIAWILYHAYAETGEERYRIGAEWAMEFLNQWPQNPAYELQLAYGAYTAARMNAELGTQYDVEKLVNWCFEVGPLRSWGAIIGNWGGYDVSGLIGEVSGNDYAFLMNGFQQAAALVPLTRYDDRFSRAIAKWVLNLANASRLFYPKFLPPENQDSEEWSFQYDPQSVIGHEAMRKEQYGQSPFATGDAVRGGWGNTNLALYASSHVGYLGAVVDTTNVPMILRLDALKTDFFRRPAYPTYLYFNPYDQPQTVLVETGDGLHDLYDAVANTFIAKGVSGTYALEIPGDGVVQLVLVPAGGKVTYELNRMLVNGVVVDYRAGRPVANYPPRIKSLAAGNNAIASGDSVRLFCTAEDRDGDALMYLWQAASGQIVGEGPQVVWVAPGQAGVWSIQCMVQDERGGRDSASVALRVLANQPPRIVSLVAEKEILAPGEQTRMVCRATDPDGDALVFQWQADAGELQESDSVAVWRAPQQVGYYRIRVRVSDAAGASVEDSLAITVGDLIAHWPLDGDARDVSGFGHHGTVMGAAAVPDRNGRPQTALAFDGVDDAVQIPSTPVLNVQSAITVAFWMRIDGFFARESFPISHGSWQNRWKISIIPEKKLRWTVKTEQGIADLDSPEPLQAGRFYHVAATYDGQRLRLFLDGQPQAETAWQGALLTTPLALTLGQMLPGDTNYNFKGVLDEVRLYNRALSEEDIRALAGQTTPVRGRLESWPEAFQLWPVSPNPVRNRAVIRFALPQEARVDLALYDVLGRRVALLASQPFPAGVHRLRWPVTGSVGVKLSPGVYFLRLQARGQVLIRKMLVLP